MNTWMILSWTIVLYIVGDIIHQGLNAFLFCRNDIACVQTPNLF